MESIHGKEKGDTLPSMYLVGGAVRDKLMGLNAYHDLDFAVEADSFEDMKEFLMREWGVEIFLEIPEFGTIRGRFTAITENGDVRSRYFADLTLGTIACDFVLCRKDGAYSDGRRPDSTAVGTIYDDLKRRDFTVNAMALMINGTLLDPFGGRSDVKRGKLSSVGTAKERLSEDALRIYRAVRFAVTKDFEIQFELKAAMRNVGVLDKLDNVSAERIREELTKCFKHDTIKTLKLLNDFPELIQHAVDKGIWLMPTTKG